MDIGDKIKKLRTSNCLTQEQLAKKCGLSKNAIWNYENNKRSPDIKTLQLIANELGVPINNLVSKISIGFNIKRIRESKNLTQKELAKKANLSEEIINKYENDDIKPKVEILKKISSALNIYFTEFFTGILPYDLFNHISPEELLGSKVPKTIYKEPKMYKPKLCARSFSNTISKAEAVKGLKSYIAYIAHSEDYTIKSEYNDIIKSVEELVRGKILILRENAEKEFSKAIELKRK